MYIYTRPSCQSQMSQPLSYTITIICSSKILMYLPICNEWYVINLFYRNMEEAKLQMKCHHDDCFIEILNRDIEPF